MLLSRPVQTASNDFVEQSLSERASERRARKVACILLAAAVLSCVAFLLFGGGINCAVAAAAAVLCMGAPLSSTLIAGMAAGFESGIPIEKGQLGAGARSGGAASAKSGCRCGRCGARLGGH